MLRNSVLFLLMVLFSLPAFAGRSDFVMGNVYGVQSQGCIQTATTTTGANRSVALEPGKFYVIYCYNGSAFGTGDACRYVQGGSTIDVNSIGGSRIGKIVYAGQQDVIFVTDSTRYVSVISETASQQYDLCRLN